MMPEMMVFVSSIGILKRKFYFRFFIDKILAWNYNTGGANVTKMKWFFVWCLDLHQKGGIFLKIERET